MRSSGRASISVVGARKRGCNPGLEAAVRWYSCRGSARLAPDPRIVSRDPIGWRRRRPPILADPPASTTKHRIMDYRTLGTSGLLVSAVGLGCNNFGIRCDLEQTRAVVHKALDLGITLFDTADSYGRRGGSETLLGQILGSRRKEVVLATKFGTAMDDEGTLKGASRRYIMTAVEASLRRLQTDWIDLYQLHHPDPTIADRRDAARARRSGPAGQGPPYRQLQFLRRAGDRGRRDGAPRRPASLRLGAERIQPSPPRYGAGFRYRRWSPAASACCPISRWPVACSPGNTGARTFRPERASRRHGRMNPPFWPRPIGS